MIIKFIKRIGCLAVILFIAFVIITLWGGGDKFRELGDKAADKIKEWAEEIAEQADKLKGTKDELEEKKKQHEEKAVESFNKLKNIVGDKKSGNNK
ncbi:MAG: hypothetical protein C0415_01650 [Thermodesulfovibrio sp.]|nr:hypothetical protein [Thermodesulfovibrio sp.]